MIDCTEDAFTWSINDSMFLGQIFLPDGQSNAKTWGLDQYNILLEKPMGSGIGFLSGMNDHLHHAAQNHSEQESKGRCSDA